MSSNTFTVTCHACGSDTSTDLPRRLVELEEARGDRLKGTVVTCESCGSEFDCYYY